MPAPNKSIALDILGDKVFKIQSWVDDQNKERQAAEWSRWQPPNPRPTFKGRSTIPHNNRKRVPILHSNHQRFPTSPKPQTTGCVPDHQSFTAPKNSSRSRPFAGRNRREDQKIWTESRKDGRDSSGWYSDRNNQASVGNQVDAQPSNDIDPRSHPNNGRPTSGTSNLQLLHDNFTSTCPLANPMQETPIMIQAMPKPDYVPPHLRNRQSASLLSPSDSAPNAKLEYVPPHLRNRKSTSPPKDLEDVATQRKPEHAPPYKRKGRARGQRNQNASKMKSATKSAGQPNGQTEKTENPSEVKALNENGAAHNGENGDLMEVYRRPVCEIPKNVWTTKPGKRMPVPQTPKNQRRRGKAFATNKEIREAYEKAPSPNHSEWANDEGWDKVFGPDEDDPNYDAYRLVDWEGNFLPCVDWTYREAFSVDPARQKEYIQTWILRGPQPGDESAVPINGGDGEIATRSWAAIKVDGLPLQDWWQEAMDCHNFEDGCIPWWTTFIPGTSQLAAHNVPDCHIDEKDEDHDATAFEKDEGSGPKSDMFTKQALRKAEEKKRRKQELNKKAAEIRADAWEYAQLPRIHAKIKLHVRFAAPIDMFQITAIYNNILESSFKIPEREAVSTETMMSRWNESKRDSFSWVVAVARVRDNRGVEYEHVLGFASATDYHSIGGMYRYTADIEVFVDPEFQRQGVGSCLMDRLMKLLTTDYDGYEGYEFHGDGTGLAERGGGRRLNAIVMNVPHDPEDHKDLEGVSKFLSKFDMKQAGNLPGVGIKLKKTVDLAIFHAKVTPEVDPKREFGL